MYGQSQYGVFAYSTNGAADDDSPILKPDLMQYLPAFYADNQTMSALQDSDAEEIGLLRAAIADALKQSFLSSATWGLNLKEAEYGLPTDPSQSYERRREMIRAKLRGIGTTTPEMIERVASSFAGGEARVEQAPGEYRFIVRFVGLMGIPPNMAGLIQMIEEIKPAHLAYEFAYTYTTWGMVKVLTGAQAKNMTWRQLKTWGGNQG
ncbi:putative phage tail protein [Gorillibacterium sp. sgz500922]|uniref:putative phage tail protein n=1 Tax=Gorillibacterium sp. sgz500922 TaxID=3446694 RepID=UPI003F6752BE